MDLMDGTTHLAPGESSSLWVLGELVTRKVAAARTGGAYSLFEIASQPGCGPPPHIQHREDECFYVIEGEYEFLDDGGVFRATAGSLVYVPRGTLHAHKNVGESTGRMLVSQTPGGLHERFFEELGEEARDPSAPPPDQSDAQRISAVAARYGVEISPAGISAGQASPSRA
jgi:quercetin dioxygenase-like cupin family protein